MAMNKKLDWQTVAVDTMPAPLLKKYTALRTVMTKANEERKAFEEELASHLKSKRKVPDGQAIKFGWAWGKLAIAFADPADVRGATAREQFTF